ncbi:MAG: hypothetical protein ABII12_03985 [Planctomycetota bacterium]
MIRKRVLVLLLVVVPLSSAALCPQASSDSPASSIAEPEITRLVTLGQDANLWWDATLGCSADPGSGAGVFGSGTASGSATLPNPPLDPLPGLSVAVSAPRGASSSAQNQCTLQAKFDVLPDPALPPGSLQGMLGRVVCDVSHMGTVGDSRGYILDVTLEVTRSSVAETRQHIFEWADAYPGEVSAGGYPYPGGGEDSLVVDDVWFQAGESYLVVLHVYGAVFSSEADPTLGGSVELDVVVRDLRVEFGFRAGTDE